MANAKSNRSLYGVSRQMNESMSQSLMRKNQIRKGRSEITTGNEIVDALVVVPPDGGWGWCVVVAAFVSNFVIDGTMYTFGIFLEEISTSIGCTRTQVALANSLMTGFYYLSGPFIGALINKCGYRVAAVLGGTIGSIAILATSFCSTILSLIIVYGVVGGIGFGMIYLSSTIVVGFYFERWRALAQSVAVCGSSLGIICFPPIFQILLKYSSWREKFRILSGLICICIICGILYRPLHPVRVVTIDDRKIQFFTDRDSLASMYIDEDRETGLRAIISRYHNIGYPTTAEIHGHSAVTLQEPRRISTSSMFIGASGPSASISKASVKVTKSGIKSKVSNTSRSKASAERLRTVYEDEEYTERSCQCCKCCQSCNRCCSRFSCRSRNRITAARPLYRDDIFFSGSVLTLPEYARSVNSGMMRHPTQDRTALDYHLSVTRIATQKDIEEDYKMCVCCPEAAKRTLATMLDLSVLESPSFLLLSISGLFTTLGLYTPFLFVVERAKAGGMEISLAYHLLSALGVANTVGRIMSGVLTSLPNVKALLCSYVSLGICGMSIILSSWYHTILWQFGFVTIFGMTVASVAALRPIIVVDMLGLERLTNGFGITLVFQGVACLTGVPLAGYLKEATGNYDMSFYFAGGVVTLSAILLVPIKSISNWEKRKQTRKDLQQAAQMKVNK